MLTLLSILALFVVSLFVAFRVPIGKSQMVTAEIKYKVVDFDLSLHGYLRDVFEKIGGHRKVNLVDERIPSLYIAKSSKDILSAESPWEMKRKNYTVVATFKVWKVVSGDYCATLVDTVHVAHQPVIRK